MGMKVFVIEKGSYSDYRVVGVFSSKENAQVVYDALESAGESELAEIACWDIDPNVSDIRKNLVPFDVIMLRNGDTERVTQQEIHAYNMATRFFIWERTKSPAYKGGGTPDALVANVWAKDAKHAIKIVNEHRARMLAEGEW